MTEKLLQWLQEVGHDPDVQQPGEPVALQQARNLLDQIQVRLKAVLLFLHRIGKIFFINLSSFLKTKIKVFYSKLHVIMKLIEIQKPCATKLSPHFQL